MFKLQDKNVKKADELFYSELDTRKKYILVHSFPYWVLSIIQAIGIYAILYYALNIDISISLGTIYLILYYVKECESPLKEIFNQLEQLQTCFNSYKRIKVLLNETNDEIIEDGEYIENLNGNIEFKNVSMRYDKELILNDNVYTTVFYCNKDALGQQIANLVQVIGQEELIRRTGGCKKTIEFKEQEKMKYELKGEE